MWASGDFTLEELAERFDISPSALHRRFKNAGIEKGQARHQLQEAIQQSLEIKARERAQELMEMAAQVKELHLKGSQMLSKRLLIEVKTATEKKRPLGSIRDDIRAINEAAKVLQTNYATIERILRLDREETPDDDIPDLVVRRMSPEDVIKLREAQAKEIEDMTAGFEGEDFDPDELLAETSPAGSE